MTVVVEGRTELNRILRTVQLMVSTWLTVVLSAVFADFLISNNVSSFFLTGLPIVGPSLLAYGLFLTLIET